MWSGAGSVQSDMVKNKTWWRFLVLLVRVWSWHITTLLKNKYDEGSWWFSWYLCDICCHITTLLCLPNSLTHLVLTHLSTSYLLTRHPIPYLTCADRGARDASCHLRRPPASLRWVRVSRFWSGSCPVRLTRLALLAFSIGWIGKRQQAR